MFCTAYLPSVWSWSCPWICRSFPAIFGRIYKLLLLYNICFKHQTSHNKTLKQCHLTTNFSSPKNITNHSLHYAVRICWVPSQNFQNILPRRHLVYSTHTHTHTHIHKNKNFHTNTRTYTHKHKHTRYISMADELNTFFCEPSMQFAMTTATTKQPITKPHSTSVHTNNQPI